MITIEAELKEAFKKTGDDYSKMITTLTDDEKKVNVELMWGNEIPFSAWGEKYVYFFATWDTIFSIGYAPRNPSDEKTRIQGQ